MQNVGTKKTSYSALELNEFKKVILAKINEAEEVLKDLLSSLQNDDGSRHNVGDGAKAEEKESITHLAERQKKFIKQLEAALVRIENKTYGICSKTGELIPKGRLLAVPHTTLCIHAKSMAPA